MQALTVDQPVIVSRKTPMPPKHHSRKLAEWKRMNFNGVVVQTHKNSVLVQNTDKSTEMWLIQHWISLDNSEVEITPLGR